MQINTKLLFYIIYANPLYPHSVYPDNLHSLTGATSIHQGILRFLSPVCCKYLYCIICITNAQPPATLSTIYTQSHSHKTPASIERGRGELLIKRNSYLSFTESTT